MGAKTKSPPRTPGEPFQYDPQFTGPIKKRSCTDILCLFLFIIFIVAWIVLAVYAYKSGNPDRLFLPTDSQGHICGQGNFTNKKHLFFFDLTKCLKISSSLSLGCPTPQVCVESCPNKTFSARIPSSRSEEEIKKDLICKYDTDMGQSLSHLLDTGQCADYYIESKSLGGRCLPAFLEKATQSVLNGEGDVVINDALGSERNNKTTFAQAYKKLRKFLKATEVAEFVFKDLKASWKLILLGLVVAMIISFLWILLMRFVAGIMVWLSILLVLGLTAFGCYYTTDRYLKMKSDPETDKEFKLMMDPEGYLANRKTWLGFAIVTGAVFVILFLILLFLRKRISISIALIKEGSKAIGYMISSLFFPLLIYLLQIIVLVFWGSVAIFLAANDEAIYRVQNITEMETTKYKVGDLCSPKKFLKENLPVENCAFEKYGGNPYLTYAQLYNLFGLFWGLFFVVGVGQVSLAGAFASYYWAREKPHDIPTFAVASGIGRCLRYHTGSVAFGSLLLATVRVIRVMLEALDRKLKQYKENFVAKCCLMCCKCFFWCLEKFIKFINKNAYIMMAVYGKNFCTSAKNAFKLLMRNIVRVVVIDKVTDFLLFIGKLVVVGTIGVASFFFFTGRVEQVKQFIPDLNYYWLPITVITLGSYVIANCFFSVYNMAVDTLFLCFLEDCERNDGSPTKPYYMSKELMRILGKKNKFLDPAE